MKSIGKVFRKVGEFVKKAAIPLLVAGAVVFTGGAALGLGAFAGGWGGAVASGLSAVGLPTTGALGSVLTGAVTQAGYGAAIGGAVGAATGQGFTKGATMGAIGGALTGGVGGLLSPTPAATTATMSARNGLGAATGATAAPVVPGAPAAFSATPSAQFTQAAAQAAAPGALPAAAQPAANGIAGAARTGLGKFLESPMAGQTIAGAANGLMTGMAAKDAADAEKDMYRRYSSSYDIGPAETAPAAGQQYETPGERWAKPRARWRYNRETGNVDYG